MTIPFTYVIEHIPSGKHYIGVKYAKGCKPEDLFTEGGKYKTRSDRVAELIKRDGRKAFKTICIAAFAHWDGENWAEGKSVVIRGLSEKEAQRQAVEWEGLCLDGFEVHKRDKFLNIRATKALVMTDEIKDKIRQKTIKSMTPERRKELSEKGKGKKLSIETRRKISERNKGRKHSVLTKEKMSKAVTPERRLKLSEKMKGRKVSKETGRKISESKKGKKRSELTKKRISDSRKGKLTGIENHFYGKKHSAETRKKMSDAAKRRERNNFQGKKHSAEAKAKMREAAKRRRAKPDKGQLSFVLKPECE